MESMGTQSLRNPLCCPLQHEMLPAWQLLQTLTVKHEFPSAISSSHLCFLSAREVVSSSSLLSSTHQSKFSTQALQSKVM